MSTIKIAIVDDNELDIKPLKEAIIKFQDESEFRYNFEIETFNRGINFIDPFDNTFDAVFLDIDMPVMSGMETAKKIRELGSNIAIIFVTNYASLAIDGYGVDALDFVVKPVKYEDLVRALNKVINKYSSEADENKIIIKVKSGYQSVKVSDIKLIEVNTHDVFYYTTSGVYKTREVLKEIEKNLPADKFVKCSSSYLVNLDYVDAIDKDDVRVDGMKIKIARTRKKEFISAFLKSR